MEKPRVIIQKKYPFFDRILNSQIQKSLEKPMKLNNYDGKGDLDKYVRHVDDRLNYYPTDEAAKCKFFALTLAESTRL